MHVRDQYQAEEPESGHDLDIYVFEHFFDLPVPVSKIAQNRREFAPHRVHIETGDVAGETLYPYEIRTRRLPGQMERPHHDPGRVGVKPQFVLDELEGAGAPNGFWP